MQSLYKNDLTPKILTQFGETAFKNDAVFLDYYKRLRLLAMTVFEWENLPETMNARYLEKMLYFKGLCCFCYDDNLGWLSLPCNPCSDLNIYDDSIKYNVYSNNYNKEYDLKDIVLIRNNYERIPTDFTIRLFSERLYEAERAIEVNVKAQKTPILIRCDEKQRLTLKNVYMKYDGNEPVIFGDKNLDISNVEVLKTDADFVAKELEEYKNTVWSEALTFLGINSTPFEKKERLVVDEVNSNNQMISASANVMLASRKQACKEFNKLTGLNINVKIREYNDNYNNDDLNDLDNLDGGLE